MDNININEIKRIVGIDGIELFGTSSGEYFIRGMPEQIGAAILADSDGDIIEDYDPADDIHPIEELPEDLLMEIYQYYYNDIPGPHIHEGGLVPRGGSDDLECIIANGCEISLMDYFFRRDRWDNLKEFLPDYSDNISPDDILEELPARLRDIGIHNLPENPIYIDIEEGLPGIYWIS